MEFDDPRGSMPKLVQMPFHAAPTVSSLPLQTGSVLLFPGDVPRQTSIVAVGELFIYLSFDFEELLEEEPQAEQISLDPAIPAASSGVPAVQRFMSMVPEHEVLSIESGARMKSASAGPIFPAYSLRGSYPGAGSAFLYEVDDVVRWGVPVATFRAPCQPAVRFADACKAVATRDLLYRAVRDYFVRAKPDCNFLFGPYGSGTACQGMADSQRGAILLLNLTVLGPGTRVTMPAKPNNTGVLGGGFLAGKSGNANAATAVSGVYFPSAANTPSTLRLMSPRTFAGMAGARRENSLTIDISAEGTIILFPTWVSHLYDTRSLYDTRESIWFAATLEIVSTQKQSGLSAMVPAAHALRLTPAAAAKAKTDADKKAKLAAWRKGLHGRRK